MSTLVGAFIESVVLYALVDSIFHIGPGAFLLIFAVMLIFCLPIFVIKGFVSGLIDRSQDRADARAREIVRRMAKRKSVTYVDRRKLSVDNRSITILKEDTHGTDKARRVGPGAQKHGADRV